MRNRWSGQWSRCGQGSTVIFDRMVRHREHSDRVIFRSGTDGGRRLIVVAQIVRDGVRPITAWEEDQ